MPGMTMAVTTEGAPVRSRVVRQLRMPCCSRPRTVPQAAARPRTVPQASASAAPGSPGAAPGSPSLTASLVTFLDKQTLPVALVAAICLGLAAPGPAVYAAKGNFALMTTFVIFVISGLQMKRGEAAQALVSWRALLFGLVSILLITPMAAKIALSLPIVPREFAYGLAVFCCMPTSLSANIALTTAVGGNTAMSLLLTVTSNVLSIFTMPFVLALMLATSGTVTFEPVTLVINLMRTVLVPLILGACLRVNKQLRNFVDTRKRLVRNLATMCLVTVPYTQIGMSKASGALDAITLGSGLTIWAITIVILILFRVFNIAAVDLFRFGSRQERPETIKRAVILAASQKTLPVAITVLTQLAPIIGPAVGLASIPCVLAHFTQVVIDSLLVTHWLGQDAKKAGKKL